MIRNVHHILVLFACLVLAASSHAQYGDFDGDGYSDLAVGVPGAEEVHILYGSESGLGTRDQVLQQGHDGMPDSIEWIANIAQYDAFGSSVAVGDFNADGFSDLAIGAPGEAVARSGYGTIYGAGGVVIVYGSEDGLEPSVSIMFTQESSGIADAAEEDDRFGSSVATGDFNGDGRDDLLIGAPFEDLESCVEYVNGTCQASITFEDAGIVHVLYGTGLGLSSANSQLWHQDISSIEGDAADDDYFGWSVAAGYFNTDNYADAAIGVPHDLSSGAGAVNVIYGSASRLTSSGNKRLYRGTTCAIEYEGETAEGDLFGWALAVGDFNKDDRDDLAIGAPGDDLCHNCDEDDEGPGLSMTQADAGSVTVLYGSWAGLHGASTLSDQFFCQDTSGINNCVSEELDWFGYALVSGDFDSDGRDDLAIGVPGETIDGVERAGMVHVLYGSVSAKLTTTGSQNWHQDEGSGGIAGDPEEYDNFGMALASGDFNNDNKDDLAVGVPNEDVSGYWSCGAVNVIYGLSGSWDGLDELNNVCWHRGDAGIEEGLSDRDGFGAALGSSCSSSSYYEVDHTAYGVQTSVPFPFNLFD